MAEPDVQAVWRFFLDATEESEKTKYLTQLRKWAPRGGYKSLFVNTPNFYPDLFAFITSTDQSADLRALAMNLMSHLITQKSSEIILETKGYLHMEPFLRVDNPLKDTKHSLDARLDCLYALVSMSVTESVVMGLLEAGVADWLFRLMTPREDETIQSLCGYLVGILYVYSRDRDRDDLLMESGCLEQLIPLCRHIDPQEVYFRWMFPSWKLIPARLMMESKLPDVRCMGAFVCALMAYKNSGPRRIKHAEGLPALQALATSSNSDCRMMGALALELMKETVPLVPPITKPVESLFDRFAERVSIANVATQLLRRHNVPDIVIFTILSLIDGTYNEQKHMGFLERLRDAPSEALEL